MMILTNFNDVSRKLNYMQNLVYIQEINNFQLRYKKL